MKNNVMVINRETAMSFWNKSFGKVSKVKDFAGKEIVKAAYNDRNSDYGWNIDHILPQSKGGKTTESNLICCHISTNDEKADKFPCFSTNGKQFEIVKVENHYEIKEIGNPQKVEEKSTENDDINFYDYAAGIRFYKSLKGIQNKQVFVGTVVVQLYDMDNTAIIDFIDEIFCDKSCNYQCSFNKTVITIKDFNMPRQENMSDLLDRCILLNTYLKYYFITVGAIRDYNIFYGVHILESKLKSLSAENGFGNYTFKSNRCPLEINELVKINTEADKKINNNNCIGRDKLNYNVYVYDYIFTKLAENLKNK